MNKQSEYSKRGDFSQSSSRSHMYATRRKMNNINNENQSNITYRREYKGRHYVQKSAYQRSQKRNPSTLRTSSQNQSTPSSSGRKNRGTRKWILVLIVAIAVLVIAGAIFAIYSCSAQPQNNASQSTHGSTPAPEGRIVMTLRGTQDTQLLKGEEYVESGCRATDKQQGDISQNIKIEGDVDNNETGDYIVTYSVTNSENMEAKTQRTVHVVDNMDKDVDGIAVMMYHNVYDEANPPSDVAGNSNYISTTKLDEQLAWLVKNGYYYPSYKELRAYIDGKHSLPSKSVILTFDDADGGFLANGIPLLQKHKVPATTFVICNKSYAANIIKEHANPYLDFQSHTYACHQDGNTNKGRGGHIYDMNLQELKQDLNKAAEICGSNEAMAYPYGDVSDVSSEACKQNGILCAFTILTV